MGGPIEGIQRESRRHEDKKPPGDKYKQRTPGREGELTTVQPQGILQAREVHLLN